jgi:hypothetical protein
MRLLPDHQTMLHLTLCRCHQIHRINMVVKEEEEEEKQKGPEK